MVPELSDAFMYTESAKDFWKVLNERYGQSNGPLIFQLERELSKVSQGNLSVASYFNKLKRCWDKLSNLNGIPSCTCGKMAECTCDLIKKFLAMDSRSKLMQFLMKLNDDYESVRSQILSTYPLPSVNKAYYIVQQVEKQRQVLSLSITILKDILEEKRISSLENLSRKGIINMFALIVNRKKAIKKGSRIAAQVVSEEMIEESPFGVMNDQEQIGMNKQGLDQQLVVAVCQEVMKMFNGKNPMVENGSSHHVYSNQASTSNADPITKQVVALGKGSNRLYICKPTPSMDVFTSSVSAFHEAYSNSVVTPFVPLNKESCSNFVMPKPSVTLDILHARLGHTSLSKMAHFPDCKNLDASHFHCDSCMVSKAHRLH
uniref:uncharacterized protein LOC122604294 n=1 Tax=Erigeron canadensis TaxID=72917 RepID=UPI001CB8F806|nr:uncharacterized protein LOC122604294 [Erigeron canadensis]